MSDNHGQEGITIAKLVLKKEGDEVKSGDVLSRQVRD